jgi:colanic acid/amylovoran biosynthesis protein
MRLNFFGAAEDTPNLGVSALHRATVLALLDRIPDLDLVSFDNGWGERPGRLMERPERSYRRVGARRSRRLHRPESYVNLRFSARLGGLGNPGARALIGSDALLDITGGDSFTDLYGRDRFAAVTSPKRLALELGIPLILLPQTYGPFGERRSREAARRYVRAARQAWARDEDSYRALCELAGDDADRCRLGVDVAFGLPPRHPGASWGERVARWRADGAALAGLNVSGLIWNDPTAGPRFGHRADYRRIVEALARRLLDDEATRLVLVPHVVPPHGPESDREATTALVAALPPELRARIEVVSGIADPGEVKWVISQLDWFVGTRMHATIASLSSGVPSAALAYSLKARGVFASCGQEAWVADLRSSGEEEIVDVLWRSWRDRDRARPALRRALPLVMERLSSQFDAIVESCHRDGDAGS